MRMRGREQHCLGYWWHTNLIPVKSIEDNISKARRAFFSLGSIGAYRGALNPLSGRSLFSTFVLPILLYGSENWILTESLLTIYCGEVSGRNR